jgi:hypothetical protein
MLERVTKELNVQNGLDTFINNIINKYTETQKLIDILHLCTFKTPT